MSRLVDAVAPPRLGSSFRWLLGSSWTSNLGDGFTIAAGPLLVASKTGDPFLVALAVVLQRLPWLLFGLLAGVVADRFDRQRIMVSVHTGRAALVLGLCAAMATDNASILVVLVAIFLIGAAEVFVDTTAQTLLPMVVAPDDLPIGNARLMAGFVTVNSLVGPPIGAALFAIDPLLPFGAQAACMLIGAVTATRLTLADVERQPAGKMRREIAEGLAWLWRHAAVRTLAITIVTFNVTFGAAFSILVLYATERLGTDEVGYGLLMTAIGIGGLTGSFVYGRLASRYSLGNLMRAGLIIETTTHLLLALTTVPAVALAIFFVFGAHEVVWGTTSTSIRQRAVPAHLQGRISSVYMIGVHAGIVVGSLIGGIVADAFGVVGPLWFAFGVSVLLVAILWRQLAHVAHDADEPPLTA